MSKILINGQFGRNTPAQLADSVDINGGEIYAADLAALQGYADISVLTVGQLGFAADTGITYQFTAINNPPTTPHTLIQFGAGSSVVTFNLDPSLTSPDDPYILGTNGEDVLSVNWDNFDSESGNDPVEPGVITAFIYLPNANSPALTTSTSNGNTAVDIASTIPPTKKIQIVGNRESILSDTSTQQSKVIITFSDQGGLLNNRSLSNLYAVTNFDGGCLIQSPIRFSYDLQYGGSVGGSTTQWQYNAPNIFFGGAGSNYDGWLNDPEQNSDGQLGRYSINQNQSDAFNAANSPSASNPVATIADISSSASVAKEESSKTTSPQFYSGMEIATTGQTAFTISGIPVSEDSFSLYLNGQKCSVGTDYARSGSNITWISPIVLDSTSCELIAMYNFPSSGISYQSTTISITPAQWSAPTASSPTVSARLVKIGKFVVMDIDDWFAFGDGTEGVITTLSGVIPPDYRPSASKAGHAILRCFRFGNGPDAVGGLITVGNDGIITAQYISTVLTGIVDAPGGTGANVTIKDNGEIDLFQTIAGQGFGFYSTTVTWIQS